MKNWTTVFGNDIPTAVSIVDRLVKEFPNNDVLIIYMEDEDTLRIQKNQYQDEGFLLPVGEWGEYKHPDELTKKLKHWQYAPSSFRYAIEEELNSRGIKTTRGMAFNPADGIRYNPHAIKHINATLVEEIKKFMFEVKVKDYRIKPLTDNFGVTISPRNKYISNTPSNDFMQDMKKHIEDVFNVSMGKFRRDGTLPFEVLDYVCSDTDESLRAQFEDPANLHLGTSDRLGNDIKYRSLDAFIMARGKLTVFRYGYVAGKRYHDDVREVRIVHDNGASFLVDGQSVSGYVYRTDHEYYHLLERAKLGTLDASEIYEECLPDYLAEYLITVTSNAHDREKAVSEKEALAAGKIDYSRLSNVMPVDVKALKAGDRFGACDNGRSWYWCEVQSVDDTTIFAWVINGAYKLSFDKNTGLVLPAYGVFENDLPIVYTAHVPFKHHASYNEAIDFMAMQLGHHIEELA